MSKDDSFTVQIMLGMFHMVMMYLSVVGKRCRYARCPDSERNIIRWIS